MNEWQGRVRTENQNFRKGRNSGRRRPIHEGNNAAFFSFNFPNNSSNFIHFGVLLKYSIL